MGTTLTAPNGHPVVRVAVTATATNDRCCRCKNWAAHTHHTAIQVELGKYEAPAGPVIPVKNNHAVPETIIFVVVLAVRMMRGGDGDSGVVLLLVMDDNSNDDKDDDKDGDV